ncbi:hypothetical protein AVEN_178858-1 [Araneus ventricosus]|uniref:Uncharacterized protein n=1 Tax=Araneus ventricosus TaxID=182803 RepID=A0A4Y2BDT7_ARAVE|nr:hypothetical protein AVEN_178858-1 [Araneus ventricosus]
MEGVLSLKFRPMDAKIGTIYHWIWTAGPKSAEEPHTGWSGFIKNAAGKRLYEKSAVIPLSFVNLQPSNPTSVNTCLCFADEECRKRQQRCIMTFAQPPFIKAMDIISQSYDTDELSKWEKSWVAVASKKCEVFAKNAVVHMANGHVYAKALRAHTLSKAAMCLLMVEYCEENGLLSNSDVETLRGIHNLSSSEESFLSKVKPLLSVVSSAVKTLEESSLKAKLWLQNLKKLSVIHYFVRAERTDDWNLNFYSVQRMLVHPHAAGHIHYAKSAHLYLQNMSNLKTSLSDQKFNVS